MKNRVLFISLFFVLPAHIYAASEGEFRTVTSTNNTTDSSIKAVGTCIGITSATENTYNITITGLNPAALYHIDLDGDNKNDVFNFTGANTFTTSPINNTNIAFKDGTVAHLVQVDEYINGNYDARIMVHEVLCTDADDDGDLDFSAGCNSALTDSAKGYIVATTAPYNSDHVYVYTLTNLAGNALAANTVGLFTNLENGTNGTAYDYQVTALNFSTKIDAQDFMTGLVLDAKIGTIVTPISMSSMECSSVCGTIAYDISCRKDDVALIKKVASISNTSNVKVGDKLTFDIEIFNQGTDPIFEVVVEDIFQKGYSFLVADNRKNDFATVSNNIIGGGKVTTLIAGPIAKNTSQVIQIVLRINPIAHNGNLANLAEIIEARQTAGGLLIVDTDSDLSNQMPAIESETDNEISNNPTDQDDFDFAKVELVAPIPTMSEWGVLIFGLLILNLGVWIILRGGLSYEFW